MQFLHIKASLSHIITLNSALCLVWVIITVAQHTANCWLCKLLLTGWGMVPWVPAVYIVNNPNYRNANRGTAISILISWFDLLCRVCGKSRCGSLRRLFYVCQSGLNLGLRGLNKRFIYWVEWTLWLLDKFIHCIQSMDELHTYTFTLTPILLCLLDWLHLLKTGLGCCLFFTMLDCIVIASDWLYCLLSHLKLNKVTY